MPRGKHQRAASPKPANSDAKPNNDRETVSLADALGKLATDLYFEGRLDHLDDDDTLTVANGESTARQRKPGAQRDRRVGRGRRS
jgi:hypothetical protein